MKTGDMFDEKCVSEEKFSTVDSRLENGSLKEYVMYSVALGAEESGFEYEEIREVLPEEYSDSSVMRDLLVLETNDILEAEPDSGEVQYGRKTGFPGVENRSFSLGDDGLKYVRDRELDYTGESLEKVL